MTAIAVIILPMLYIALQYAALKRMRAGWQVAALLPVALISLSLLVLILGLIAGVDMAMAAVLLGLPAATLYLMVLLPLYFALRRPTGG